MTILPGISAGPLLMLLLFWLPTQPSGQQTKAADVYRYVVPRADLVFAVDVGSVGGSVMRNFNALANEPFIRGSAKLSNAYRMVKSRISAQLAMIRTMSGIDPLRDLRWVTVSARVRGRPRWLVAASGNINKSAIQRIARRTGASSGQRLARGVIYRARHGSGAFGWARGNVVMMGDAALVRAALGRQPHGAGKARSMAMGVHDSKSFLTVAVTPTSRQARRAVSRMARGVMRSLIGRFGGFAASMRYDGLRVGLRAGGGRVTKRYGKLLDGLGHFMTAAEHILRGAIVVGDGLLSRQDARALPRGLRGLATAKPKLLRYLRKHIALAKSPSHSVRRRGRLALLDYKGSRHAGIVPVLFGAGFWLTAAGSRSSIAPPAGRAAPPAAKAAQPAPKTAPYP